MPDHGAFIARWTAESDRVRRSLAGRLDLPYGPRARHRLDLFPVADPPPGGAPLLAFVHGGYWKALDARDFAFPAPAMVEAGIAYAALAYPLAPEAGMDEIVDSVRRALVRLARRAGELGIDPARIHVAGHSAGGHLTAMMLATDWSRVRDFEKEAPPPGWAPAGGVAISGLYDLEPIRLSYLNEDLGLDPEVARRNSPIHAPPAAAPPLVLCVGGAETDEFRRQQADFAAVWRSPRRPVTEIEIAGAHHFSIVDLLADPASPLFRALQAQIMENG